MEQYNDILEKIEQYQNQLKDPSLTDLQKQTILNKIGELTDYAKRITFNISMCEEDNLV